MLFRVFGHASFVAALVLFGCEARGSAFSKNDTVETDETTANGGDVSGADGTATDVPVHLDIKPNPADSWVFTQLPDEWIEAPPGFCEQLAHQTVVQFINDGDTIKISGGDAVRFLGVDAAEVAHESAAECYGDKGQDVLMALLEPSKTVCLYADPNPKQESKDIYDRLLRYVYIKHDGRWLMLNHRTIRLGAAQAYHSFLKNITYRTQIEQAEIAARDLKLGGWAECGWKIQ